MSGQPSSESGAVERREREWQLAPRELDAVRHWLREHGESDGLRIEPLPTLALHDRYLDTDSWSVLRAGFALRIRNGGNGGTEATLKSLSEPSDGFVDRFESTQPLASAELETLTAAEGPVTNRVRGLAGTESLEVLFEAWTRRERFAVVAADGPIAEIALDESRLGRADGPEPTTLTRIEVEALGNGHPELPSLVAHMRSACELVPAPTSKFQAGLLAAGLAPKAAAEASVPQLTIDTPVAQAALIILRARIATYRDLENAVRHGDDAADLHDLRVAARRLAVSVSMFAQYLPARTRRVRPALQNLVRAMGAVRDIDVQVADIDQFATEIDEASRASLQPLRERLLAGRTRARRQMLHVLDSKATQRALDQLETLARTSSPPRRRSPPVASVALPLARRRYRKLRRAAERAATEQTAESLHAVRTTAKKMRYLLEALEPMYGEPVHDYLRALRRLQNVLGDGQDAHVGAQRIAAIAGAKTRRLPGDTLFTMGRLVERSAQRQARARKRFPRELKRIRGKRWKSLRGTVLDMEAKHARSVAKARRRARRAQAPRPTEQAEA